MREYKKPVMNVEHFIPNEFISACGDSGTVYNFECNAGDKGLWVYPYEVYLETNNQAGLQTIGNNKDTKLGNYHACGVTHEAESDSGFHKGYMVDTRWGHDSTLVEVIVWRGEYGNDIHCTTNLDMNTWTTAKS